MLKEGIKSVDYFLAHSILFRKEKKDLKISLCGSNINRDRLSLWYIFRDLAYSLDTERENFC